MIHMRLSKWLLAALSVLSCAGAGATSTAPDVAFDSTAMEQMRTARALGAAPTPKDCDALGDKKTCKKADGVRIAACPSCGGTELTHHGGNKSNYYYRCKKCDPNKSGKTFKAPRPPASYNKKKVA